MQLLSKSEIESQSNHAYERWRDLWHVNASKNAAFAEKADDIAGIGQNKKAIIFSFGTSLKENIRDIKSSKLHYECDVICIDKALKTCLVMGIIPKYCVISDAQVSFEEYGDIAPEVCARITLLSASTANYKWAEHWNKSKGKVYFYLNKDSIRTHRIFGKYFKDKATYLIPAGSNVGNAAYALTALILGYRAIYLAAYNYSFPLLGDYYGEQSEEPIDFNLKIKKKSLYNHYTMIDLAGNIVQCSHNMQFSAKWLLGFVAQMHKKGIDTVNITGSGILKIQKQARIRKEVMTNG